MVLQMDPEDAVGFIRYLKQKRIEDRIFLRWIVQPQFEMSLDEFKSKLTPQKVRSEEEILDEVYAIFEKAGIK